MKKLFFLLSFVLASTLINAQTKRVNNDDLYYHSKTKSDTVQHRTNIQNVQFCLGSYYKQRQTGLMVSILGGAVTGVSVLAINNSPGGQQAGVIFGGILSLSGIFITLDAEKWLKKASISISPTSLKVNF